MMVILELAELTRDYTNFISVPVKNVLIMATAVSATIAPRSDPRNGLPPPRRARDGGWLAMCFEANR